MKRWLLALVATLASACSTASTPDGGTQDAGATDGPLAAGTVIDAGVYTLTVLGEASLGACDPHAEQASHFTDTTADWGLSGVAMNSAGSVDLDHDGYPYFILFSGNADQREVIPTFWDGGFHNLPDGGFLSDVAVLMNRPKSDGGRMFVETTASGLFQTRDSSSTEYRMAQIAAVADVNGDGYPDILSGVARDADNKDKTSSFNQDHSEIMLNDGRGHFGFAPPSDPASNTEATLNQVVFSDVDNDGKVDLFFTYWYADPGNQSRAVGNQPQLYRGNGDGTFANVTLPSGLGLADSGSLATVLAGTNARPAFGTMACDITGDGYPDLLVSAYGGEANMLYVNDGNGGFTHVMQDGGFDGDTDTDYRDNQYYLCYCSMASHKKTPYCSGAATPGVQCPTPADSYWSPGFSDAPALANGNNFSAACRDMNGDGRIDVFQGTIRHWWAGESTDPSTLLLNQGTGSTIALTRVPGAANDVVYPHIDPQGWNEGIQQAALVDMDNDGRPDILNGGSDYSYQYGHLFIQQADGTYLDQNQAWGLFFPCMDGLAVADYDRDGDLDVVVRGSLFRNCSQSGGGWPALPPGCQGAACSVDPGFAGYAVPEVHIFTNNAGEHSHWLEIRLRGDGTTSNTMGIGAKVSVTLAGATQMQEVQSGHGIGSEMDDPTTVFFGLGNCGAVDKVTVTWPNRSLSVDSWANVPSDHYIELRQADPNVYGINLGSNLP